MLTAYDDFPIHGSALPVCHPVSGDPNLYDRYFFNGHSADGSLYFGATMAHYPVRGVVDAAVAVVLDGVQHSLFASGRMPRDRATVVGPIAIEVLEPLRRLRVVADSSSHRFGADLVYSARSIAVEEPRQYLVTGDGLLATDHTRLTQWGLWEGWLEVDGRRVEVNPSDVTGTRDRSWGIRPVGPQLETNRSSGRKPQIWWLWAPLHFDGFGTHIAIREAADGRRWVESGLVVPFGDRPGKPTPLGAVNYELAWRPGLREASAASFTAVDSNGDPVRLDLDVVQTFRMRGLGYTHPVWGHGTSHGSLAVEREWIRLVDIDPLDDSSLHLQSVVRARLGDAVGVGVLEQYHAGPHGPSGLPDGREGRSG